MDSGTAVDTGLAGDTGPAIDAAAATDSGAVTDSGAATDSGPSDGGLRPRQACCTAWCQDDDRFGPGSTVDSEGFIASAAGCSSTTGCTCAVSAWIASTWTVVTGGICDAHDFATSCPGSCDGTQCPVVDITGRLSAVGSTCTCVGAARPIMTGGPAGPAEDVWDSDCAENAGTVTFLEACPMP